MLEEVRPVHHQRAENQVTVATQVLGGTVHHDVRAERQRPLEVWTHEGVVDHDQRPALVRQPGDGLDVDEFQQGVGRRLDPDHAGTLVERLFDGAQIASIDKSEGEAHRLQHAPKEPVAAAVQVVHCHRVVARFEQLHDGGLRCHP